MPFIINLGEELARSMEQPVPKAKAPRLGLVAELKRAARATAAVSCGSMKSVSVHGVSYADAAELWSAGFRVNAYVDGNDAWFSLSLSVDGAYVTAYTIHRPPLDWERERAKREPEAAF